MSDNIKCDVIVPIYNAHEWVSKCIEALLDKQSIKYINKLILVDDASEQVTKRVLASFINPVCIDNKEFLENNLVVLTNEQNQGFVKSVNRAINYSLQDDSTKYCLVLNSDCLVAPNTISKLLWHMENVPKIALACPLGCNMDSLSIKMFKDFSYIDMDNLFGMRFKHQTGEARAVFGNCLMFNKDILKEIGLLDEVYGRGYCEEVDYQYRAMVNGYGVKVALDCYVFHKAHASFGKSKQLSNEKSANMHIFLERYEKEYMARTAKLMSSNAVLYVNSCLTRKDRCLPINPGLAKINKLKKMCLVIGSYFNMIVYVFKNYGFKMTLKACGNYVCSLFSKKV